MRFSSPTDGWFAAGMDKPLFVTHDGGNTWAYVSLPIPFGCSPASAGEGSVAPVFDGARSGVVEVRGLCGPNKEGRSWFFSSIDGGSTWQLTAEIPAWISVSLLSNSTWAYADGENLSNWVSMTVDGGAHWQRTEGKFAGAVPKKLVSVGEPGLLDPTFVSLLNGWAWLPTPGTPYLVIATSDGGHTWRILTP
jgi:photosystem II stability/assembly factor-like uncharacterized protein